MTQKQNRQYNSIMNVLEFFT